MSLARYGLRDEPSKCDMWWVRDGTAYAKISSKIVKKATMQNTLAVTGRVMVKPAQQLPLRNNNNKICAQFKQFSVLTIYEMLLQSFTPSRLAMPLPI